MESQWTNKYAILRDLSVAQGRMVPTKIVDSIEAGQKPPTIKIKEDSEEELFQNCDGVGALPTEPDLNLIKEMINMVKESELGDNDNMGNIVVISKLNPLIQEFVPQVIEGDDKTFRLTDKLSNVKANVDGSVDTKHVEGKCESTPKKKGRARNVAILSLLEKELSSEAVNLHRDEHVSTPIDETSERKRRADNINQNVVIKHLEPNYFIRDANVTEAVDKVNEWLQKPVQPVPSVIKRINVSPSKMFKKKNPAALSLESTCMFKRKSDSSSIKSSDSDIVQKQPENVFVPSDQANEYYKKFVDRCHAKKMVQEDIWKRAERLMKEIDAKRLKEKDYVTSNNGETRHPIDIPGLSISSVRQCVLLPQHRHDLPEECKVCLALAKHKNRTQSSQ